MHFTEMRAQPVRRLIDVLGSLVALVILSPVILLIAILARVYNGTPVLFHQYRPGQFGKPFNMVKFRTMLVGADNDEIAFSDERRITRFGKWLRSTSLDELPEFWNVLKGDMSLIGPRPLLLEYMPLYTSEQMHRHVLKPGITGWAQVNGRNDLLWEEKFRLDLWYVKNQSFFLDLKIVFLTVKKICLREGITAIGHVSVEKFSGTKL